MRDFGFLTLAFNGNNYQCNCFGNNLIPSTSHTPHEQIYHEGTIVHIFVSAVLLSLRTSKVLAAFGETIVSAEFGNIGVRGMPTNDDKNVSM